MRHATSKKIFSYWNTLRGDRSAPDRREIEPSDIRDILGDTFILEVDPKFKTISFRLAGTRLCNAYARELKGVGFLGLWDELDNLTILETVKCVYQNGTPCTLSLIAESANKKFVEYEMLLLPLKNGGSSALRVLGTATPTEFENWIGADPLVNNRLKSARTIDIVQAVEAPSLVPENPGQDDSSLYRSSDGSKPRRVAHLTVFEGGIVD